MTEVGWWLLYDWVMGENSSLAFASPLQFLGYVTTRNTNGSVESALFEYDTDWAWASGFEASTDLGWRIEDLRRSLDLRPQTRDEGRSIRRKVTYTFAL